MVLWSFLKNCECLNICDMELVNDLAGIAAITSLNDTLPFIARLPSAWTTSPQVRPSTSYNVLSQRILWQCVPDSFKMI